MIKAKYIIILLLLLLLGWVVAQMLRLEERIRESRIVEVVLEDTKAPLIEEFPLEQISALVDSSTCWFKAEGDYFKVFANRLSARGERSEQWEEVFLKGVNMGVALPGKWPSEFAATYDQYLEWFIMIGNMNANTIRTYTILPPEFYKALAWHNLHYENKKLWLMQGVWAEEPPKENYANGGFTRTFLKEIRDAIDAIHGNLVREPRHGHADGVYTSDVSAYTIGWALGREWEPHAVSTTNRNDSIDLPYGVFIDVLEGNPMEKWLAGVMEFTARYETQTYLSQRPISFINWLTLDPMHHNSEMGVDDLESIDMEKFSHTHLFKAGLFASYHVYPYYPDYIYLEEKYTNTLNHNGKKDNFLAYLIDLKKHQQGMPLVIAEYGVPNSRGNSHYTPFGYHHGGYSEKEQAEVSVLMTENIHRSGCGGAICFAWMDEWFKNNWLVMELEEPQERRKYWHNVENPEQNYGIIAMEARKIEIDGKSSDWDRLLEKPFVLAEADPAYFYLAANMPEVDFARHNLYIAVDTYDKRRGGFKLPFLQGSLKRGAEFLVEVRSPNDVNVLVDHHYDVYSNRFTGDFPGYQSVKNSDGLFVKQFLLSNPSRVDVLGDTSVEVRHNRGKLQFGKSSNPATSNAGIYWTEEGFLEMRISWQVLNVADPSTRMVIDGRKSDGTLAVTETEGFHLSFFVTDKKDRLVNLFPGKERMWFSWDKWDQPTYNVRVKPIYHALAKVFKNIKPLPVSEFQNISPNPQVVLCQYFHGRMGAITYAFDGRCYSQYSNALPLLKKYALMATFSKTYYGAAPTGGTHYLQLSEEEYRKMGRENHEVRESGPWVENFATREVIVASPWRNKQPFVRVYNDQSPNLHQVDSILKENKDQWTVFLMRHIYDPETRDFSNLIHLAGKEVHNISPDYFEKLIRIGRNTGFWIAPFHQVIHYFYVWEKSRILFSGSGNRYFLTVANELDAVFNNRPVTVKYIGPSGIIRVRGSASDGVFRVRGGELFIDMWPNREATFELLKE